MASFRTLAAPVRVEIDRIKGSRFVADAAPAADEAEAEAVVEGVRRDFPGASHHCFAWRLDAGRSRAFDDGEPGGTAGAPILRRLDGKELLYAVVVVTRWFGGTKLGTGGLVRAYGEAATAALDAATITERIETARRRVTHAYDHSGPVQGVMTAFAARTSDARYAGEVSFVAEVALEDADAFARALVEATAGKVRVERLAGGE